MCVIKYMFTAYSFPFKDRCFISSTSGPLNRAGKRLKEETTEHTEGEPDTSEQTDTDGLPANFNFIVCNFI